MSEPTKTPTKTPMLHLNLTFGETPGGGCAKCGGTPVLVTAADWHTHPADDSEEEEEFVELDIEVSGHYCPECHDLVSLYLNRSSR